MIYDKFPIIFKLEERTLTSTDYLVHIFLADLACW